MHELSKKIYGKRETEHNARWGFEFGKIPPHQSVEKHQISRISTILKPQCPSNPLKSKLRKNSRLINYWRDKRNICKHVILNDRISDSDPRPYVNIHIAGKNIAGLLDSGATHSFLGKNSLNVLRDAKIEFHRLGSFVKTADGTRNRVEGYVYLNVRYAKRQKSIKFLIVPTLEGELYLGT